ncbi:hypothetical protein J5X84_12070 [Streptosporangiaceae bacterium NEAU-GS5]|nr:hypothetical protein [Streptosporangiaceae bacterium NEAU-GS5]
MKARPDLCARALAAAGPAYEAIQNAGEPAFLKTAATLAAERVRDGLPLRASVSIVGFRARKPE